MLAGRITLQHPASRQVANCAQMSENDAMSGHGSCWFGGLRKDWRRGGDSNPRYSF